MQFNNSYRSYSNIKKLVVFCFAYLFGATLNAQCAEPDASIWLDTWVSCEKKDSPKPEYGLSHWIQYDLGTVRTLSKSWIWNTNDPHRLDQGFNQVKIDYSNDGQRWTYWGEMNFPKAQGKAVYGGFPGPDMINIKARYVLFTVLSTHGADCAGLAEVKFNLLPEVIESPKQFHCDRTKAVEQFNTAYLSSTEAKIFWINNLPESIEQETEFFFEIRPLGFEEWFEFEPSACEIYLDELEPGTTYEYRVLFFCDDQTRISATQTFTTLMDNATPINELFKMEERMSLVPNPTQSDFMLHFFSPKGGQLHYSIKDLQGKTLLDFQSKLEPGNHSFPISLGRFPDGIYLVNAFLERNQVNLVERVVKISQ